MSNKEESLLNEYIRLANAAITAGKLTHAHSYLQSAAKTARMLAKGSAGAVQKRYLEQCKQLTALLESIDKKIKAPAPIAPVAPQAPAAPSQPFASTAPIAPTAPVAPTAPYMPGTPTAPAAPTAPNAYTAPAAPHANGESHKKTVSGSNSLAPRWLSEYVGQPKAVTAVKDLITAAKLKNAAMPHIMLYGSHGLGKSTFSRIIANELGVGFTEINVSKITIPEMVAIFKKLKPRDVVFIDEIHTLPLPVAESVLYSAMQDGRITYIEGKGKFAKPVEFNLPPFTLIGATTEIGKLAKPFTHRTIAVRLEEYTDEVLAGIIAKSTYKLGMSIVDENALLISKRCRNNPRTANNMIKRITDKALVKHISQNNIKVDGPLTLDEIRKLNISISQNVILDFFEENGIDEYGLENGDRELLKMIIHRYGGGPVGLDNLARAMNESNNVIAQKYEAYLIKKGLVRVDRDGRVAMPDAYKVLGLPVPKALVEEQEAKKDEANNGSADAGMGQNSYGGTQNDDTPQSKYDKRTVIVAKVPDEIKCEKVEELIVYPENAVSFSGNLDELFSDVEKPIVEAPKHFCLLELDFDSYKRTIECDSFLESRFATMMATVGFAKDLRAQTLEIPYISQELSDRRYFPDFVVRDYKDRIAVIEMKNFDMCSYHLNIDKYERLKEFCIQHGYGYAEVMQPYGTKTYVSVEMLKNAPVNAQLEQFIYEKIEQTGNETGTGQCDSAAFAEYEAQFGKLDKCEVYTILLNNRRLKNVDRSGNGFMIQLT